VPLATALGPVLARGQLVPPAIPGSPQPAFPKLPAPAGPASAPATGAPAPQPAREPVVSARTQRVTLGGLDRSAGGVSLRARDETGQELVFEVRDYTAVLAADASRLRITDLRLDDPLEVTWFPQGDRRALLTIRRLP
jgi:hypothetical protein